MARPTHISLAAGITATAFLLAPAAFPCTTFLAQHDGQPVFGKDYDWNQGAGLVVINPRGLHKSALVLNPQDVPASWTSKYASLTFNQYGVEFPNGGINEKGLAVDVMWLDTSTYPATDNRPALNELAWIQHALDNFDTVAALAQAAPSLRVSQAYAKVHYLACDSESQCAAFEYIGGQLVITRGGDLVANTLTNNTYADSVSYLAGFDGYGGTKALPTTTSSLDRFVRTSMLVKNTSGTTVPSSAFGILESAAQSSTQWSIVYALKQGTVAFRTKTTPKIKTVRLDAFATECPAKRKVLNIDTDATGDVTSQFSEYTSAINQQVLSQTMAPIASALPQGAIDLVINFPDTCTCASIVDGGPSTDTGVTTQDASGVDVGSGANDAAVETGIGSQGAGGTGAGGIGNGSTGTGGTGTAAGASGTGNAGNVGNGSGGTTDHASGGLPGSHDAAVDVGSGSGGAGGTNSMGGPGKGFGGSDAGISIDSGERPGGAPATDSGCSVRQPSNKEGRNSPPAALILGLLVLLRRTVGPRSTRKE